VLREGKNREIRRILARLGHKVMKLSRIAVGPIRLGEMPLGSVRKLSKEEIAALRNDAMRSRTVKYD
jgi:23S rRNA pseudouridine2605 synthase